MSDLDNLHNIVREIRLHEGYSRQEDVARLTPYKPPSFSKILTGTYGRSQDQAIKRCLISLREALDKLKNGEPLSLGPVTLWQSIKAVFSNLSRREISKAIVIGSVVTLTMLYPIILSFNVQPVRDFIGTKKLSSIEQACFVNLFVVIALLYLSLILCKVAHIKNNNKDIRRGVLLFSSFWALTWLSWILLYIEIWITLRLFPNDDLTNGINPYLALRDILNLLNSFCVLGMFIALYFTKISRKDWGLLGMCFVSISWLAIGDRMYDISFFLAPLEGQGELIIDYVSALSFLLLIGRLNSLFIKVNLKLLFIFIFYLYALLQLQLGPGDLKEGIVLFYSLPKVLLWLYIYQAFFSNSQRLPEYLDRAYREV